jgi:hypothetical protein
MVSEKLIEYNFICLGINAEFIIATANVNH